MGVKDAREGGRVVLGWLLNIKSTSVANLGCDFSYKVWVGLCVVCSLIVRVINFNYSFFRIRFSSKAYKVVVDGGGALQQIITECQLLLYC